MRLWFKRIWCGFTTGHAGRVERDPSGSINHVCSGCGKWAIPLLCACGSYDCPHYVSPLKDTPTEPTFDWLRDYGPYWHPGSTAFWLEPETEAELAAWKAKYEAPRKRDYLDLRTHGEKALQMQQAQYSALGGLQQAQYSALSGLHRAQYANRWLQQAANPFFNQLFGKGLF